MVFFFFSLYISFFFSLLFLYFSLFFFPYMLLFLTFPYFSLLFLTFPYFSFIFPYCSLLFLHFSLLFLTFPSFLLTFPYFSLLFLTFPSLFFLPPFFPFLKKSYFDFFPGVVPKSAILWFSEVAGKNLKKIWPSAGNHPEGRPPPPRSSPRNTSSPLKGGQSSYLHGRPWILAYNPSYAKSCHPPSHPLYL